MNILSPLATRLAAAVTKPLAPWSAWPLRLIVGYGFMAHGYAKLARGPDAFIGILQALGVPAPTVMGWTTIVVELLGGLAVLLGAYLAWVCVPMAAVLIVAALTVHLPNGFSSIKLLAITATGAQFGQPGYETDLLYLACLGALVLGGAGPIAVDGFRARGALGSRRTPSPRAHDGFMRNRHESRAAPPLHAPRRRS